MSKKCKSCNQILSEDNFTKNKNNKDGLSYYCRACTKKHYDLYLFNKGDSQYENIIIDELKKDKKIKINGLDIEKIKNLRIIMYDYPGLMRPLLKDLPKFLKKYNLSYEEYKFIKNKCEKNEFWIE